MDDNSSLDLFLFDNTKPEKEESPEKTSFDLDAVPESGKRDLAFTMVVALRDTMTIAVKRATQKERKPTYENCIRLFADFSPELYKGITKMLPQRNINEEAKIYITEAELKTKEDGKEIDPVTLVEADLAKYNALLKQVTDDEQQKKVIRNKIRTLEGIKKSLKPRYLTENRILIRDFSRANREDFGAKFIGDSDFYVDYELGEKKFLRIRLLHPDIPEHITGADLVYEQHDEESGKIRIAFLQYKLWDSDGVFHFSSSKNFEKQLRKLDTCLCQNNFCSKPENKQDDLEYRFPYCCAFFRPTDKLQDQGERLVSSGIHIPICKLPELKKIFGGKIERKSIRFQSITQDVFEYLFNRGLIGSRWMDEKEVEKFYKDHKILESDDTITFYAREVKTA